MTLRSWSEPGRSATTAPEYSTFTDQTRPSAAEVDKLIDLASEEVLGQLPDEIDPEFFGAVSRLITIRAAVLIGLSFFRNQVVAGSSAATMTAMYLTDLRTLADTLRDLPVRLV